VLCINCKFLSLGFGSGILGEADTSDESCKLDLFSGMLAEKNKPKCNQVIAADLSRKEAVNVSIG
jgi:hypothetical protein